MFTAGRALLGLLEKRYETRGRLSIDMVAIVVVGVLASAFTTEQIGIHAIFGAFVFGAIMPSHSGMARELTEKIEDFTVIVLLPIFFAVTGLRTDLFTLNSPALIGWLILILLVATLGKFAGTGLAAWFTGSSKRDSIVIGALMNTRGLTELVILTIGLSLGVLSDRVFAMMVIMALATTLMAAPIVFRLVSRDDLMGGAGRAFNGTGKAGVSDSGGAGQSAERPRTRRCGYRVDRRPSTGRVAARSVDPDPAVRRNSARGCATSNRKSPRRWIR